MGKILLCSLCTYLSALLRCLLHVPLDTLVSFTTASPPSRKPILTLPPKEIKTIMVDFSLAERHFYDALHKKSLDVFQGFLRAGTASKSWLTIFSLLHRLRQTCDHVALTIKAHQDPGEWDSNIQNMVGDDVAAKSGLHPFDTDKNTKVAASAKPSDTIDQKVS